jgi:deoxyribodipyrimidine photolyase-like uncharacterized protein
MYEWRHHVGQDATLFEDLERICRELRAGGTKITYIHRENIAELSRYLETHDWSLRVLRCNERLVTIELSDSDAAVA